MILVAQNTHDKASSSLLLTLATQVLGSILIFQTVSEGEFSEVQ
jgi:hypothetical protein